MGVKLGFTIVLIAGIKGQRQAEIFSSSPFGRVTVSRSPGIIYFIQPNKLHCKILESQNTFLPYTLCSKYFSELSLKITHNVTTIKIIIHNNQIKNSLLHHHHKVIWQLKHCKSLIGDGNGLPSLKRLANV